MFSDARSAFEKRDSREESGEDVWTLGTLPGPGSASSTPRSTPR